MKRRANSVSRRYTITLVIVGCVVFMSAVYLGFDSFSAIHRLQDFYDIEVIGLQKSNEIAFHMQESRRVFLNALVTPDPVLRAAFIESARSSEKTVNELLPHFSTLPLSPAVHQSIVKLVQHWNSYTRICEEMVSNMMAGYVNPGRASDHLRTKTAFEQVKFELTVLQLELERSSKSQLALISRALYRTAIETGALILITAAFLYFTIANLSRRRALDATRRANENLQKAQNLLQEREAESRRLAQVAARTTSSVAITLPDRGIVWVNDSFISITGYSLNEVVGKQQEDVLHTQATSPAGMQMMMEAIAEGRGFQIESVNHAKSGSPFYMAIDCQPVIENESLSGYIIVGTDITTRVRLERGLREREHRMRRIVDSMLDGLVAIDEMGTIETANAAAEKMFGYSRLELVGSDLRTLIPMKDWEQQVNQAPLELLSRQDRALAVGQQLVGRRRDGTEFPLDLRVSEVYVDGERQVIGILRDVTERQRAEEEANRVRRQLLDLTAHLPGAVFQFKKLGSSIGSFLFMNEGVEKLCGRTASEVMRNSHLLLESVYREDARAVKAELRRALRSDSTFAVTYRVQNGDELRWLQATASPQMQETGDLVWNGVIMDVTEVKNAELKLAIYAKELAQTAILAEAAAKAKSEFLATMSHEIRTPMNGVIGMTGILLETPLTPEQRDCAETIRQSGEALLHVINDILDFSKIEAGKLDLESVPFNLRSLLEESLQLVANTGHRKNLELCALIEDHIPSRVIGDPARVRQILLNLLSNAIKFTEEGEVVLSADLKERRQHKVLIRLAVRDTGPGVSDETKQKLFQSFSQADSSTTRRYGGTGLGLAISKRLVNLMNGQIGVESVNGMGSTFWIEVPFEVTELLPTLASPERLRDKRVLVVDDNQTNRNILRKQLGNAGMLVVGAASAEEALRLLEGAARKGEPFQLAVSDLHMPVTNGLMLTREIKKRKSLPELPLIILTSDSDREDVSFARELGVKKYLVKPVRQDALINAISEVFGIAQPAEAPVRPYNLHEFRGHILVAEDNITNQKVIVVRLAKLGCTVDVAVDGEEAVARASSNDYDLILMDCQMPKMDGFQAATEIRKREGVDRRVPIIALTANAMEGVRERCITAGMDDYVAKPLRPEDLIAKLQRWLNKKDSATPDMAMHALANSLSEQVHSFITELKAEGLFQEDVDSILQNFLDNTGPVIAGLAEAIEGQEEESASFAAHHLKGSFSAVGLYDLARMMQTLETASAEHRWQDAKNDFDTVKRISDEAMGIIVTIGNPRVDAR